MAVLPNLIIQKITSGAVVAGVLPLISTAAPSLISQVTKEQRGRMWRYNTLDSGSGGLFESPGTLIERLARESNTKGIGGEVSSVRADQLGFTLRRVYFQGAGTTQVNGFIRDPWGVLATVTSEAVTIAPSPDGAHKSVSGVLANANALPGSLALTFSDGQVLKDSASDGTIRDSNGAIVGTVDYSTGAFRVSFKVALATGTTLLAAYKYGSAVVDYQFLATNIMALLAPATFTWSPTESGGREMLVPPGWQVRFTTVGALSGVGSIGILCDGGQQYLPGQQLPGFGVSG